MWFDNKLKSYLSSNIDLGSSINNLSTRFNRTFKRKIVFFCVYLPFLSNDADCEATLLTCVEFIRATIFNNNFADYLCWAGDFKMGWECVKSNSKCVLLFNFLTNLMFCSIFCIVVLLIIHSVVRCEVNFHGWRFFVKSCVANNVNGASFGYLEDSCNFNDRMTINCAKILFRGFCLWPWYSRYDTSMRLHLVN